MLIVVGLIIHNLLKVNLLYLKNESVYANGARRCVTVRTVANRREPPRTVANRREPLANRREPSRTVREPPRTVGEPPRTAANRSRTVANRREPPRAVSIYTLNTDNWCFNYIFETYFRRFCAPAWIMAQKSTNLKRRVVKFSALKQRGGFAMKRYNELKDKQKR